MPRDTPMKNLVTLLPLAPLASVDAADPTQPQRPSILLVLTDDQGYGDLFPISPCQYQSVYQDTRRCNR